MIEKAKEFIKYLEEDKHLALAYAITNKELDVDTLSSLLNKYVKVKKTLNTEELKEKEF